MPRSGTFLDRRFMFSIVLWLCVASALRADEAATPPSPATGALADTIWFDSEQDELIPVAVDPIEDDSLNRDSRWLPQAERVRVPKATPASGTTGGGTTGGNGWFGTGLTFGNLFGWLLLLAVVSLAVFVIAYALSKSDFDFVSGPSMRASSRPDAPDEQTLERMKHLPAELRRTDVNLRSEAERLMLEQNFDQAIILVFAHQLLLLDRAGLLRLNRGKTNRRYVRETASTDRESAGKLQATVDAFERSYFGRHSITAAEFQQLWLDNQALEQAVQRRQEVAA